jgi:hypothetical protein
MAAHSQRPCQRARGPKKFPSKTSLSFLKINRAKIRTRRNPLQLNRFRRDDKKWLARAGAQLTTGNLFTLKKVCLDNHHGCPAADSFQK